MVKRALLGTVTTAIIASASQASSGFYMGAGFGQSYGTISNTTSSRAFDELEGKNRDYGFGDRKLKRKSGSNFAGKLITGYEYDLTACSLLLEAGYLVDTSKRKYDKTMVLNKLDDVDNKEPAITSMKLERKSTLSLGIGAKKGLSDKVYMMGGLDVLNSKFKYQANATGSYTPGVSNVDKSKSKFGLAPWVGISYDMDVVEAGLRYQYAKYQVLKMNEEFSSSKFSINSKMRPAYHTFMLTLSKKF